MQREKFREICGDAEGGSEKSAAMQRERFREICGSTEGEVQGNLRQYRGRVSGRSVTAQEEKFSEVL